MKRILDSVHGYITIPEELVTGIVDTVFFQRLRRIEQTSGRSLFPSARHDRFIHSLGVFYLGSKIVDGLISRDLSTLKKNENYLSVLYTYEIACLLHDVGHTPFSHTFENYYENPYNKLKESLLSLVEKEEPDFVLDFENQFSESAPHERISAILSVKYFRTIIENTHDWLPVGAAKGNVSLLARMIVGCRYQDNQHCLENSFIDLLHSKVLDADGLDYVCRDSWASGYSTSLIDIDRLIDSITILDDGNFTLCYKVKAINEIKAVLSIKDFQQSNVFTHHLVKYEQALLRKAMESVALTLSDKKITDDPTVRREALQFFCRIESFEPAGFTPKGLTPIFYPMDDDFISMMKYCPEDEYVKQWISRNYKLKALWKSRERFILDFKAANLENLNESSWIFTDHCRMFISDKFGIDPHDIWIEEATPKSRLKELLNTNLLIDGAPLKYQVLYSKEPLQSSQKLNWFYYIYLPIKNNSGEKLLFDEIRKSVKTKFFEES